jgi:glycine oxidase
MAGFDVAVVGAGIAGCAVAWGCQRRGARVVVVERGSPGGGASGAAAGMLAPCSEAHGPGPFLDLARRSLGLWPGVAAALLEEGGVDCELELTGLLRPALDGSEARELRERLAWQRAADVAVRWLDGPAAGAEEPALAGAAAAALYPDEGHVHSVRAVAALLAAARRQGAELICGAEVVGALDGGGVRLAGGRTVAASRVVVCAGAWSGRLAAALGAGPLPVEPVRGQLLALRGLRPAPRRVLFAGPRGYAVTKRDGLTLVGATEERAGFEARPTEAAAARLRDVARLLLRGAATATADPAWVGLRPLAPDGLPLLGRLGEGPRGGAIHVATGHHRNGVLLAPVTAEGMASVILDGVVPAGWEHFDPCRFATPPDGPGSRPPPRPRPPG